MNPTSPAPTDKKHSRAGVLLMLYVLAAAGVSRTLVEMKSTEERIGAISVPLALLCAGCWYAYKEGGRVARISAAVLALLAAGSFGFGLVKGVNHTKAAKQVNAEFEQIRAGLVEDTAEDGLGPDAARKLRDRTQAAASRMKDSEDTETAALGRVMESMGAHTRAVEERLLNALDAVGSERFMKTDTMLATNDFEWQRATALEYGAAAKAAILVHAKLPNKLETELANSELPKAAVTAVMTGFNRTWALSGRVYQAHVKTAKAYGALIDYLDKHEEEIEAKEDGSLSFQAADAAAAYNKLLEKATAADTEVNAAVQALSDVVTKR
jgi:hypothetical protein